MGRRRFAGILYAQNKLGATGGAIERFQQFRAGTSSYTTTPVDRGPDAQTAIEAFGFGDPTLIVCSYSGRANGALSSTGLSAAILGHQAMTDAVQMSGFRPANAIVFVGTGSSAAVTSKITGLSYKKRAGESFTFPYGKTTGTEGEFDRQRAIFTAVEGNTNRSVSFRPERIYKG